MIKVVLADDNRTSLDSMEKILKRYNGIEIVGKAKDGAEELQLIMEKKPDVIVTDIEMPFLTGIDVIEKIQYIEKGPTIIVATGATSSFVQAKLNSLPIYQIFRKPIDYEKLAKEILTIEKLQKVSHETIENCEEKEENKKKHKILNFFNKLIK